MSKAKTPTINAGILKDHLPKLWAFWACEENTVFYLIRSNKKIVWKTIDEIDDTRDMVVFKSYADANTIMKDIIKNKEYPAIVNNFQIGPIIPSYEDGYWYQDVPGSNIKDVKVK